MPTFSSGLIIIPSLTQRNVTVDMQFSPSVGISARKFDKLALDIRSFREPLRRAVRQVMIPSIRQNFDAGGRPEWEPLAAKTVMKKKGDARPLIRTGELRKVMGYMNVWSFDTEKAMITDLPQKVWYGKVHQAGHGSVGGGGGKIKIRNVNTGLIEEHDDPFGSGEGGDGSIPARPFVVLQDSDILEIDDIFTDWVGERIAAVGLGGRRG